jgi:hypothetical protein
VAEVTLHVVTVVTDAVGRERACFGHRIIPYKKRGGEDEMAEKKVTPKAPAAAKSESDKEAATRVTKRTQRRQRRQRRI